MLPVIGATRSLNALGRGASCALYGAMLVASAACLLEAFGIWALVQAGRACAEQPGCRSNAGIAIYALLMALPISAGILTVCSVVAAKNHPRLSLGAGAVVLASLAWVALTFLSA